MQLLFGLRVLLWRCCSCGVCTDSSRWVLSASGWHTQFHPLRAFFRLGLTPQLSPHSASLFPSFHPSFLPLPHFPPQSTSSSLLPNVFVSRVLLCVEPSVRLSVCCGRKDAAAKGGLGSGWGGVGSVKMRKTCLRSKKAEQIAEMSCVNGFFPFQKLKNNKISNKII